MTEFAADSLVEVRPFAQRSEGDTVTIGDVERQVFLAIPASGLDILHDLASGHTVGQAARRYEERHGETADVEAFLEALAAEGFVAKPAAEPVDRAAEPAKAKERYVGHLSWVTPEVARRLLGRPVLITFGLMVAAMIALIVDDPGAVPTFKALIFPRNLAELSLLTFAFGFSATMLHEVAHVVAARAAGAPARIRISNRLFIPVIETDMTGIWLAPKGRRYLAFLAGLVVDAASLAVFIAVLWAERRDLISLSPNALLLLRGVAVTYIGRIAWQTFLFVRTDFYYTLATALNCKSLMADTENFLENQLARLRRRGPVVDQSGLPRREMRAIRFFAVLWLLGRVGALLLFATVTVPVLWFYLGTIYDYLTNADTAWRALDFAAAVVLSATLTGLGVYLWARALLRGSLRRWRAYRTAKAQAREVSPATA